MTLHSLYLGLALLFHLLFFGACLSQIWDLLKLKDQGDEPDPCDVQTTLIGRTFFLGSAIFFAVLSLA